MIKTITESELARVLEKAGDKNSKESAHAIFVWAFYFRMQDPFEDTEKKS